MAKKLTRSQHKLLTEKAYNDELTVRNVPDMNTQMYQMAQQQHYQQQ